MWSSPPARRRLAVAGLLSLAVVLVPVQAGGGEVTTETLHFAGLGGDPVAVTTEALRFTGRARGE